MDLRRIVPGTNGSAHRQLGSWIDAFVEHTANLESAPIFRQWAAITTVAAALEQRVWVQTTAALYPNLYTFLVGHPGVGKTRTISCASQFVRDLPEFRVAPTSMTMASMVDSLVEAKRVVINMPDPPMEFNCMYIMADELGAFMHKYDDELIGGLTTFYDANIPYLQVRRGNDIRIKIKRPQLSILSGTTPSNLLKFMPEIAWDQGFTSRVIMVFSDERPLLDDIFSAEVREPPKELFNDLKCIFSLCGRAVPDDDYRNAIANWRRLGYHPAPNHPKLSHYCSRRLAHLLKLSIVASVDRGDSLLLTKADFNRAMGWLLQAEEMMPEIFQAGSASSDGKAMDEIYHFVVIAGRISEAKLVNYARERVPAHSVLRLIEIMEKSGMIKAVSVNPKTGLREFAPGIPQ